MDSLGLVGEAPSIVALRQQVRLAAQIAHPVLVSGPPGAGKSLVVKAIHRLRSEAQPGLSLVEVSCAHGNAELDVLLFGTSDAPGLLATSHNALLVLDEVTLLPMQMQGKLARLLQTGKFRPAGSANDVAFKGQIVALTSKSLTRCEQEGRFRSDLLYALGVVVVPVPGLDSHSEDIPRLVEHFLSGAGSRLRFSPQALELLARRRWSGHVRELESVVRRAVLLVRDPVVTAEIVRNLVSPDPLDSDTDDTLRVIATRLLDLPLPNKLAAMESTVLDLAMRVTAGNKSAAARLLGLNRKAVERRLEKFRRKGARTARRDTAEDAPMVTSEDSGDHRAAARAPLHPARPAVRAYART